MPSGPWTCGSQYFNVQNTRFALKKIWSMFSPQFRVNTCKLFTLYTPSEPVSGNDVKSYFMASTYLMKCCFEWKFSVWTLSNAITSHVLSLQSFLSPSFVGQCCNHFVSAHALHRHGHSWQLHEWGWHPSVQRHTQTDTHRKGNTHDSKQCQEDPKEGLCVCMHVCACMVCACMVCACMCVCMHVCVHACMCACVCTLLLQVQVCVCMYVCGGEQGYEYH